MHLRNKLLVPCPFSLQVICGVCGSYSGHLYERLAQTLGDEDGLTMKADFCEAFTSACDGQIDFPDYDGVGYCTMHTGGSDDLFWSYPYEESEYYYNVLETSTSRLYFIVSSAVEVVYVYFGRMLLSLPYVLPSAWTVIRRCMVSLD